MEAVAAATAAASFCSACCFGDAILCALKGFLHG